MTTVDTTAAAAAATTAAAVGGGGGGGGGEGKEGRNESMRGGDVGEKAAVAEAVEAVTMAGVIRLLISDEDLAEGLFAHIMQQEDAVYAWCVQMKA